MSCAILANFQQSFSEAPTHFISQPIEAFSLGYGNCRSQRFARQFG
jgi:hypothetical protein